MLHKIFVPVENKRFDFLIASETQQFVLNKLQSQRRVPIDRLNAKFEIRQFQISSSNILVIFIYLANVFFAPVLNT